MTTTELATWLIDKSAGNYRPAAEAANRLLDQANEIKYWKQVAGHLASCHAATLESLPKSAPKQTRGRLVNICADAASFLRQKKSPPSIGQSQEALFEWEIKRCEDAATEHAAHIA